MTTYYGEHTPIVGSVLRFNASIYDIANALVNPDTVTLTFRCQGQPAISFEWINPTGDVTGTIVNSSTGVFYADYQLPNSGSWTYQWNCVPSSGTDTTATSCIIEGEILISASGV